MTVVALAGVAVMDFVFSVDEMPRRPEKYRARDAAVVGGGCAANAAVAVARLGGTARLASRVGADPVGDMILAGLAEEGVETALVRRVPGARSSFSSILVDGRGERLLVGFRDPSLDPDAAWLEAAMPAFDAALADTRWPEGAAVLMRAARRRGVPGVIDAEAPVAVAAEALSAATHVAFSEQGLADFAGGTDPAALALAHRLTGAVVCVTRGERGVDCLGPDGPVHVPAFRVDAVDTLGAGDVWHGAFALRLGEGAGTIAAARFANAVAAIKCTRFGGRAGTPARSVVDAFLEETP